MESNDSYPVFHTRLARTQRRRLTKPDGSSAGWLIVDASSLLDAPSARTTPQPSTALPPLQLRRVPGAQCPVRGCTHHHENLGDFDDPPQLAIPRPR